MAFEKFGTIMGGKYEQIKVQPGHKYLVNVGSVGQPRDRNPEACFVHLDLDEKVIHFIRVPYDIKGAQDTILANNLPAEYLDAFNKYSKRVSLNAVDEITRWLNEHDAGKDSGGDDARYAAGVGLFQINKLVRNASTEEGSSNE